MSDAVTGGEAIRCLLHPPAPGARNMAVDEAIMEAAREGRITLRFYAWSPPCLSLGRNQAARGLYDRDAARDRGVDVVRRPTGGRAIYHHRELTYAVAAPAGQWGGLRSAYRRINRALLRGLSGLGAEVAEAGRGARVPGPSTRACFRDPLPGEIVAGSRKLVGSAQWRDRGTLLQHGSILLHDEQHVAERLRVGGGSREPAGGRPPEETEPAGGPSAGERGSDARAAGPSVRRPPGGPVEAAALSDLLDEVPPPDRLAEALRAGFRDALGLPVRDGRLSAAETERAEALEPRYRGEDWTWRR